MYILKLLASYVYGIVVVFAIRLLWRDLVLIARISRESRSRFIEFSRDLVLVQRTPARSRSRFGISFSFSLRDLVQEVRAYHSIMMESCSPSPFLMYR